MARVRSIKAGFSTNEKLADLGPLAHLLFACLWPHCDREGRMEDRPKRIKVLCMPYYECDVNELLDALARGPDPFILRYEVDGTKYLQVLNWQRHQTPYWREPESAIPACVLKHGRSTTKARSKPGNGRADAVLEPCSNTDARTQDKEQCKEQVLEGGCKGETASAHADPFDAFWEATPRKIGKAAAASAYKAAVKAIRERGNDNPHGFLLDRVRAFAVTPKAKGEFCPYPATWLNQGRYDDDPATWQDAGNHGDKRSGRRNDIGPGQRYDSATAKSTPLGW